MARHWNRVPREVVECPWKCPEGVWVWHLGTVVNRMVLDRVRGWT